MRGFRREAQVACLLSVVLLIIMAGSASAQSPPSHTQVSPAPAGSFDFPAQLKFFALLATYSNGVIANVTGGNFSSARILLANYNSTIDSLNAAANNPQQDPTIIAMKASRDDFSAFIKNAQRYDVLYVNETSLSPADARSNASIANALEMKALGASLKGFQSTIEGRNADIYGIAVDNGLKLSEYGNSTALFKAYAAQVDSRLANVTANVFRTPTLTLTGNKNNAIYGDAVTLVGSLQDNQTGITNSSVEIHVDNTKVATVPTNARGSYAYKLAIRTIAPGRHVAFANYTPVAAPYNPAQSPTRNFSVAKSPVTNTLSSLSGSIALGSDLQAQGQLTTPNGPVTNATVALVLGGTDIEQTHTDQNGTYAFSVPSTGYYLPAVLNGATAYTVFDPSGQPLDRTVSAAVHIPADLTAAYGMIAAVTLVVLLSLLLYSRGFGRRAPSAIPPEVVAKPTRGPPIARREIRPVPLPPAPPTAAERAPVIDWSAARDQARDAFRRGNDELATAMLFEAAVASLSAAAHVRLAAHMTHSEKSWAIQAALPDASAALRELTTAYELVNYGGRSLTQAQRDAALNAFDSLRRHVKGAEERP